LHEALSALDDENPITTDIALDESASQDRSNLRQQVYCRFLSTEDEGFGAKRIEWRRISRGAALGASEAAGIEVTEAFETYQTVYHREMAERAPPILRYQYHQIAD
jgi:hypothetical protein